VLSINLVYMLLFVRSVRQSSSTMCLASAVGFLLLTVAFLACGIGFLAPYWVFFPGNVIDTTVLDKARAFVDEKRVKYDGMLGRCFAEGGCVFFFQNDFEMEKDVKGERGRYYRVSLSGHNPPGHNPHSLLGQSPPLFRQGRTGPL